MSVSLAFLEFLGTTEMLVIAVVALIIFGPRRLPEIGRTVGKSLAEFKRASEDFKRTWEREVEFESIERELRVTDVVGGALSVTPAVGGATGATQGTAGRSDEGGGGAQPSAGEQISEGQTIARAPAFAEDAPASANGADDSAQTDAQEEPAPTDAQEPAQKHEWL